MLKRAAGLVLVLLISVFMVGCGEREPKEVVKDFYYSLCEGDVEAVSKDLTLRAQQILDSSMKLAGSRGGLADFVKASAEQCKKMGGIDSIKVETEKVSDSEMKWTAVVKYKNGRVTTDNGELVKTDKGWKIDIKK